ncbi:TolC family protein [Roseiconus lacunae]|uniref:TolC family protein n=1 Tax=Roseiconus lacunae TaxID=2605694 RepID=A0ABT7PR06_9BACT|nr:TolC family protein [Roseiconus lacunae]MDM4018918.1 TolC family protein [Roseiconus lacunae]
MRIWFSLTMMLLAAPTWVASHLHAQTAPTGIAALLRPESQSPTLTPSSIQQSLASVDQPPTVTQFEPWWKSIATIPFHLSENTLRVDGDTLILEALQHSYHIAALRENITIAQTGICRAAADFDPSTFVESKFVRTSVPTGSTLDAGSGIDRLREEDFRVNGGFRRKTIRGGRFEVAQRLGLQDSNSEFFTPTQQGNSRLTFSFNQPLLNGAGESFNRSLIVLAQLDTDIARQKTTTGIQNHLLAIQEAMWNLYFQRISMLLRIRHLQQANSIHQWLEKRQELDSLISQLKRAESAVASRKAELSRAVTSIRNAEDRLRSLVNSPSLTADRSLEIIPTVPPSTAFVPIKMEDAIVTALESRSEIVELGFELDSTRVRLDIARNDMLPVLDLVLESYLSGLRGRYDVGRSWVDQFSRGEPSYAAGLQFEMPVGRRAACADIRRRQSQLRQLAHRLSETIAQLESEVSAAVREVQTSHREMMSRQVAMQSAAEYVNLVSNRWHELPGEGYSSNAILEDLLDAQDRLLNEEVALANARVSYVLSTIQLKRATGTLLEIHPLSQSQ